MAITDCKPADVSELQIVRGGAQLRASQDISLSRAASLQSVLSKSSVMTVHKADLSDDASAIRCDNSETRQPNKQESSAGLGVTAPASSAGAGPATSAASQSSVDVMLTASSEDIQPYRNVPEIVVSIEGQVRLSSVYFLFTTCWLCGACSQAFVPYFLFRYVCLSLKAVEY